MLQTSLQGSQMVLSPFDTLGSVLVTPGVSRSQLPKGHYTCLPKCCQSPGQPIGPQTRIPNLTLLA